jgi:AraC-like DNA-binding protein
LAANELSITEICLAVGFQSLGSFSQLFHKLVGVSPTDYRARHLDRQANPQKYIPNCFLFMSGLTHSLADPHQSN